eukprot:990220-Heterocapsa_arctica.AAC.1
MAIAGSRQSSRLGPATVTQADPWARSCYCARATGAPGYWLLPVTPQRPSPQPPTPKPSPQAAS